MANLTKTTSRLAESGPQIFEYLAISPSGNRETLKMTASSAEAVSAALREEGWFPLKIKVVDNGGLSKDVGDIFGDRPLKFDHRELADFASQFHQLLKAGVSVSQSLQALGEETEPKRSEMCNDLAEKVNNGIPLSEAFSAYPKVFDLIFRAYIDAGEISGTLVETTNRLAVMLDRRSKLALKIKSVTAYPKLVGAAIGLIVVGIMLFLVPMYTNIYAGFGAELPAPTRVLVTVSDNILPVSASFRLGWPPIYDFQIHPFSPVLWGGLAFIGIKIWLKRTKDDPKVGVMLDRWKYKMPIFGALAKKNSLFRWASTLSGGIESGVPLASALELSAQTSGSRWQLAILEDLQNAVQSGKPLSEGLALHRDLFPPNLRAMVTTGETTGELPALLDSVASSIDSEIDSIIAGLSAKIEVALLLVMGIVVGALLAVLYLPILNLATTVGSGMSEGSF